MYRWGGGVLNSCSGVVVILEQMAELVVRKHVVCGIICVQLLGACLGICVKHEIIFQLALSLIVLEAPWQSCLWWNLKEC